MRLLHTSDWHLGKSLMTKKRHDEHAAFLAWLLGVLRDEAVDALVIAGDVFDTSAPGTAAQHLYYTFLRDVFTTPCRHVLVIGGNHDSPSFLNAPRELLKAFSVHVVGCAEGPEHEVIVLRDPALSSSTQSASVERGYENVEAVVCAVPYLRDRDVRTSAPGESLEEKAANVVQGIASHYADVANVARSFCNSAGKRPPLIVTGHLFAAGGKVHEGEGVRELSVGSLGAVPLEVFPADADYVALGHLHSPQIVGGDATRRYSGSPIPLSFAEAGREKSVCLVDFAHTGPEIRLISVPEFQKIVSLEGTLDELRHALATLVAQDESVWAEVLCRGEAVVDNLRARIDEIVNGSKVEVLRVRLEGMVYCGLQGEEGEMLGDMREEDVFARCLDRFNVAEERRPELMSMFQEVLSTAREALAATEYGQAEFDSDMLKVSEPLLLPGIPLKHKDAKKTGQGDS